MAPSQASREKRPDCSRASPSGRLVGPEGLSGWEMLGDVVALVVEGRRSVGGAGFGEGLSEGGLGGDS